MQIITDVKDPILHKKCEELTTFNLNTVSFLNDLVKLVRKKAGWGLAAPQVGLLLNAFVMLRMDGKIIKVVNPKILERGKLVVSKKEGCLSVIGKTYNVKRSKRIKVEFQNEIGEKVRLELRNLEAFVFQHEYDHLQGVLISD